MSRHVLVVLLLASAATAAPVSKANDPAQRAEDERLWNLLGEWLPADIAEAACRFGADPTTARRVFTAKLAPLELTENRARELVARLGSAKEEECQAAAAELKVFDPRLAMAVTDLWPLAESDAHRARLAAVLCEYDMRHLPHEMYTFRIEPPGRILKTWTIRYELRPGLQKVVPPGTVAGGTFPLSTSAPEVSKTRRWQRQVFAVQLLDRFGTEADRKLVKRMAGGHPDAAPTVAAKAAVERWENGTTAPPPAKGIAGVFESGRRLDRLIDDYGCDFRLEELGRLLERPAETVTQLKARMRPILRRPKMVDELLARLFRSERDEWESAFRELSRHDPRLVYPVTDLWAKAESDADRAKLALLLTPGGLEGREHYFLCKITLRPPSEDNSWSLTINGDSDAPAEKFPGGVRPEDGWDRVPTDLGEVANWRWTRELVAIHILDAIDTDDAIAVIKDMATGHADAGPTKAAKAVLARRGVK